MQAPGAGSKMFHALKAAQRASQRRNAPDSADTSGESRRGWRRSHAAHRYHVLESASIGESSGAKVPNEIGFAIHQSDHRILRAFTPAFMASANPPECLTTTSRRTGSRDR
jgi:hypothetical protein